MLNSKLKLHLILYMHACKRENMSKRPHACASKREADYTGLLTKNILQAT